MMTRSTILLAAMVLAIATPASAARSDDDASWRDGFESGAVGDAAAGWFVPMMLEQRGTTAVITDVSPASGTRCVKLRQPGEGMANLMREIDATPYRGRTLRYAASVRIDRAGSPAHLWLRVDRAGGGTGFFDNMMDRPIGDDSWARYEIVGRVADDAERISLGILLTGAGTAWLDDVLLEAGPAIADIAEPPRPLSARGLTNLTALARVIGDIRHFHPGDEAAGADWSRVTAAAVRVVEDASDDDALVTRLDSVLGPLAPTARFVRGGGDAPPPSDRIPAGGVSYLFWEHAGYGQGDNPRVRSIYHSERRRVAVADPVEPAWPRPGETTVRRLAPTAWSIVPLTVPAERGSTPPPGPAASNDADGLPEGWVPTVEDRATRLAAVILGWNVLQHFYPYHDVVSGEWSDVLPQALRAAAQDRDAEAFTATLERMVAALHDGHGRVTGGPQHAWQLPLAITWIDDEPVITVGEDPVGAGDAITTIAGVPVAERRAGLWARISGATDGWKRARLTGELIARSDASPVVVEARRPDGTTYSTLLTPVPRGQAPSPPRPDEIAELDDGIWYVDLDRVTDAEFNAALPRLATARGLVVDLRGYPSNISTVVLAHLTDEPAASPRWNIPIVRRPDRAQIDFAVSGWDVRPVPPRLTERVAFLTGGGAISYAETYLGIVEAYELAAIVGATTAGTNGNINTITLPTGHSIVFTGMKVLKHDGSRHHGVGIEPTVPVEPTVAGVAAGRDEVLDRAVELVGGPTR